MKRARRRRTTDPGFTLPEVMIAGTLTALLALPAFALLRTTYRFVDLMQSRFKTSEQARQFFTALGDGGSVKSSSEVAGFLVPASSRGFALVESVRSRNYLPVCMNAQSQQTLGACFRNSYELVVTDGFLSLAGDLLPSLSITCTAPGLPIPACTSTETRIVHGWLGSDPAITYAGQSTPTNTLDFNVTVTNPYYALRAKVPANATEQYRMMFTFAAEKTW